MRDILYIAVVLGCSLYAIRRPVFGVLAFICFSTLNPHSMTWGIGRSFSFAMLLSAGTILGYLFWSEPKRFPKQIELYILLALWGLFVLSSIFAMYPTVAWESLETVSKKLLIVFLSMSLINTRLRFHLLLLIIALSIGFYGLKSGIWFIAAGGNFMVYGPEESFLESNNSIGLALAMNVPLLFYLVKMEDKNWLRVIMVAMLIFSYPAVIGTFSRGAWLGLLAATSLLMLKSKYKLWLVAITLVVGIGVLPYISLHLPDRVENRYADLVGYEHESSAQSRLWNWRMATRVALSNPVLGVGFNYYSMEVYERYFPEFMERWPGKVWSCHSIWFTVLSEHGFPAFFLWVTLMVSCLFSLKKLRARGIWSQNAMHATYYSDMLSASLITYMGVGTFLDAAYFDVSYQLIAAVIILKELAQRERSLHNPDTRRVHAQKH
jgi:probable O-glycosylation ligase (exosortase A-associated)